MSKSIAHVLALFIADKESSLSFSKRSFVLDENGILEDKHYNKDRNRSVLLTSTTAYQMAEDKDIMMDYGSLGENIVIDYDLHLLQPGDHLQMGEVILEVVQNCTLCTHLSKIDKKLPKLLRHDRGIFTKVVKGGILHQNDKVSLL